MADGYTDENDNELTLNDAKLIIEYKKVDLKKAKTKEIASNNLTKNKADRVIKLYNLYK